MGELKIPQGYKLTEVGVIPEDWKSCSASEAINFFAGYSFSSNSAQLSGVRWLKIANVGLNEIKWDAESYLPFTFTADFENYLLKPNDIVMALTRPLLGGNLKVAKLEIVDSPALLNQRVAKLEAVADNSSNFMYYIVQRLDFIAAMNLAMAGSDPPNIGTKALGAINIPVPPSKEQTAIANALSDVDALISSLEKLINKKQAIKTAGMQQLLTGKTRLPQFAKFPDGKIKGTKQSELGEVPEDWEVVEFGQLFETQISRKSIKPDTVVTFVGMQDVSENAKLIEPKYISYENVKSGFTYFERLDVLVAKITPCFENGKGCFTENLKTEIGFGSTEFHVLRANKLSDPKYIYYITVTGRFRSELESEMVGSAGHRRVPLTAIQIYRIACSVSVEEQTAIATILSDMDTEIQTLEQRLSKTRHIKQGMMQELLTGKTRLV